MDHRALFGKVNIDDVLTHIREYRQDSSTQHNITSNVVCASFHTCAPTVSTSLTFSP